MDKVVCAKCNEPMTELWQAQVFGHNTLRHHCPRCHGVADVQVDGRKVRQIQLTGAANEYRPNAIQPHDNVELEHASVYSVGVQLSPAEQQARAAAYAAQAAQAAQAQAVQQAVLQQQAIAQAAQAAAAQNAMVTRHQQYLAYVRAQQARGLRPPAPVHQPVAYTLGPHAAPVHPINPQELRRRLMGR